MFQVKVADKIKTPVLHSVTFSHYRLLVSRQLSLVVGLLPFRLQTGWMKQLYRREAALTASSVAAGCTSDR